MAFTLLGDARICGQIVREKTAVKLIQGDQVVITAGDMDCQVLLVSSLRLDEPVAWGGPIVMNTQTELRKAFDDLRQGTFLQQEISY